MQYGGYRYGYFSFDWTYLLVIIGAALSMAASARVNKIFNRYAVSFARCGMTGADVARRILSLNGIYGVSVRQVPGNLTDHYDPRSRTVNLSESVYGSSSISAIGVAAHECGHAIQDAKGYEPLRIRAALVPVANFGSRLSLPLILIGIFLGGFAPLLKIGIFMFGLAVLFQIITLPVEFNASARALRILTDSGMLMEEETRQARQVLQAAALTYVAGATASVLQLFRLLILFGGHKDHDQ